MTAPAPIYRGQGNAAFRSEERTQTLKRGQTVPYEINGAPTGSTVADGDYGDIVVTGSGATWSFDSAVVTAFARTILDDADGPAVRVTIGAAASGAITASGLTMTTARLLGRSTAGTGAVEELTAAAAKTFLAITAADVSGLGYFATGTDAANLTGTVAAARLPQFTGGDVTTAAAGSVNLVIGANKVARAMLAQTAGATLLGATGAGNVTDLTAAQAKTFLAITASDVSGLGYFATGTDAANLTGTLAPARLPDMGVPLKISGMTFGLNHISNTITLAGAADRHQLIPWTPMEDIAITAIGVECQTAVASANSKVVVYDTSASSRGPNNLLKETGNLDCSTTGYKSEAWSYTFLKGVTYWVGVRTSSTATLRATAAAGMRNLGRSAATGTGNANVIQKTLAFATAASNPYGAVPLGQLQTGQTVYDVIATQA